MPGCEPGCGRKAIKDRRDDPGSRNAFCGCARTTVGLRGKDTVMIGFLRGAVLALMLVPAVAAAQDFAAGLAAAEAIL